jgi:glutamate carboxypeptidase
MDSDEEVSSRSPEYPELALSIVIIAMPDPILAWAQAKQNDLVTFLRELVECESPSDDAAAVERCVSLISSRVEDIAQVTIVPGTDGLGPHMQLEFDTAGDQKDGQILVLGHADTVYPLGTLASMPCVERNGCLYGPGVFDMKGGIALTVFAIRALRELNIPVRRRVVMQLNSDEEVGSPTSRALTEAEASKSVAVIVTEPAAGADGKAKTARKGVGDFTVRIAGKSSHAGLDFEAGASAILELSRQIDRIATFTDLSRGVTVNPGVISGGTRSNVVASEAWCEFDFRVARAADAEGLEERFLSLQPFDNRCSIEVEGGLNRPPLERSEGVVRLYELARGIAAELGFELGETMVGGGSDGNFTAGLGIPTLDGMGAVGDGAH